MKKKLGRPKIGDARNIDRTFKVNHREAKELDRLSKTLDMSRSDTIRFAISYARQEFVGGTDKVV